MPWELPIQGSAIWPLSWLLAAVFSALACTAWRPLARYFGFLDYPSERSLHAEPMVRAGGLPMALALALTLLLIPSSFVGSPVLALALGLAAGLMVIATWDDRRPLPVGPRLSLYLLLCAAMVFSLRDTPEATRLLGDAPGWMLFWGVLFTLGLAWMTNLYNFMDGADGLAGGQGLIGFAAIAALALIQDAPQIALASLAISGVCAGFLCWNFPPARLFLGDAGAIPLGFLAGAFALMLFLETGLAPWLALLPFAPFWLDASVTLLRRILNREAFWRPHRSHFYQRLVRSGVGHRGTALVFYALMVLCGGLALLGAGLASVLPSVLPGLGVSAVALVILVATGFWIDGHFQQAQRH
ncbi:UDP-N-acetylmuramyl pentapeptide phosphotransferase/UDP-N-acetylglucosamine-1-phosphate transferase [Natronospira proteinivora]|uniref:UDP-N-acetylmuramyl pentapeptide phosphotransferase/UDP-N-acetylglucosamine-1-phosphate transferase n=1 Tax=Natronospira proteinivora TaxID=1807133 RepID=A0ABT1G9C1_9GAMM|nr:glycosyltransferase family 4 protein [Natronospira proteinivora]MCP1727911.1 UDP-N-acetylmuramyl pentapeptide phosphotransferase/UDP-N-acetylglucosamine-1-phosphate transferase [Natronospira proteinivora]